MSMHGDKSWVHHYGPEIKHWCKIQEMIVSHAKKAQSLGQKDSYTIYSYVEFDRTVFVGVLHRCSAIISENWMNIVKGSWSLFMPVIATYD